MTVCRRSAARPFRSYLLGISCSEADDLLRFCYRRNPRATTALQDCLAVKHAKWIAHRLYRGLGPHRISSADFIPPQASTPFARNPGKGKQRGALRRFDRMFGSQASAAGSAVSPGSQVDSNPASPFSPVSPLYSPASQPGQLESVSGRRPTRSKGINSSA